MRRAEISLEDVRRGENRWEDMRWADMSCERLTRVLRRAAMRWDGMNWDNLTGEELWRAEKSWVETSCAEWRGWEDLKREELRWAEKSWEKERRHEMRWDEMRGDEMRWGEKRWEDTTWDEIRCDGMQWAISKRSCDAMRGDEMRKDQPSKGMAPEWKIRSIGYNISVLILKLPALGLPGYYLYSDDTYFHSCVIVVMITRNYHRSSLLHFFDNNTSSCRSLNTTITVAICESRMTYFTRHGSDNPHTHTWQRDKISHEDCLGMIVAAQKIATRLVVTWIITRNNNSSK